MPRRSCRPRGARSPASRDMRRWNGWGDDGIEPHLPAPASERPVLALSTARLRRLVHLEPSAQLATFEAGVTGPDLEAQLRPHGLTLGHYPQSFEYSTLGGWVVTRSSGQQSARYG